MSHCISLCWLGLRRWEVFTLYCTAPHCSRFLAWDSGAQGLADGIVDFYYYSWLIQSRDGSGVWCFSYHALFDKLMKKVDN